MYAPQPRLLKPLAAVTGTKLANRTTVGRSAAASNEQCGLARSLIVPVDRLAFGAGSEDFLSSVTHDSFLRAADFLARAHGAEVAAPSLALHLAGAPAPARGAPAAAETALTALVHEEAALGRACACPAACACAVPPLCLWLAEPGNACFFFTAPRRRHGLQCIIISTAPPSPALRARAASTTAALLAKLLACGALRTTAASKVLLLPAYTCVQAATATDAAMATAGAAAHALLCATGARALLQLPETEFVASLQHTRRALYYAIASAGGSGEEGAGGAAAAARA
jgi:hypothetical protein